CDILFDGICGRYLVRNSQRLETEGPQSIAVSVSFAKLNSPQYAVDVGICMCMTDRSDSGFEVGQRQKPTRDAAALSADELSGQNHMTVTLNCFGQSTVTNRIGALRVDDIEAYSTWICHRNSIQHSCHHRSGPGPCSDLLQTGVVDCDNDNVVGR